MRSVSTPVTSEEREKSKLFRPFEILEDKISKGESEDGPESKRSELEPRPQSTRARAVSAQIRGDRFLAQAADAEEKRRAASRGRRGAEQARDIEIRARHVAEERARRAPQKIAVPVPVHVQRLGTPLSYYMMKDRVRRDVEDDLKRRIEGKLLEKKIIETYKPKHRKSRKRATLKSSHQKRRKSRKSHANAESHANAQL